MDWEPPGDGLWWATPEHFPLPVSRLFAAIFPAVTVGWQRGAERYGLAMGPPRWGTVNGWMYFSPGEVDPATLPALAEAAEHTLATAPWRDEVRRWVEDERPAVVTANRARQARSPEPLDDAELAAHLTQAIEHFHRWAPVHFEHTGFNLAGGRLFLAAEEWGLDPLEVAGLLAGASPATSEVERHVAAVAAALDRAGAPSPASHDELRAAGDDAAEALDRYLDDYRWRPITGHDLAEPTLGESPALVLAAVDARRAGRVGAAVEMVDPAAVRTKVPPGDRLRFDELLADARSAYALRDDDVGVCFNWPLGLVRRAALEAGRRLTDRGRLEHLDHAFEAIPDELSALLGGDGPSAGELAARARARSEAAGLRPPLHVGEPVAGSRPPTLPPPVATLEEMNQATWRVGGTRPEAQLQGLGIGTTPARGQARVVRQPSELGRLADGDVLVTVTTTTAFNAVFVLLAAVVTQEGGVFSHTAILARELGLPAVVGVPDLLELVHDGDLVEVDPASGQVRVVG